MAKKKKKEEDDLGDVIDIKLTKTEAFLIKAKANLEDWERREAHTIPDSEVFTQEIYMELTHVVAFSHEKLNLNEEGYINVKMDIAWLKKMLLYYERNNGKNSRIDLFIKAENPIILYDEKIWCYIAPATEDDDDEDDDDDQ
ncbi:MAG: hypothetical protein ACTSP9_03070 [Promethearchaeota archaeon]